MSVTEKKRRLELSSGVSCKDTTKLGECQIIIFYHESGIKSLTIDDLYMSSIYKRRVNKKSIQKLATNVVSFNCETYRIGSHKKTSRGDLEVYYVAATPGLRFGL